MDSADSFGIAGAGAQGQQNQCSSIPPLCHSPYCIASQADSLHIVPDCPQQFPASSFQLNDPPPKHTASSLVLPNIGRLSVDNSEGFISEYISLARGLKWAVWLSHIFPPKSWDVDSVPSKSTGLSGEKGWIPREDQWVFLEVGCWAG